MINAFKRSSKKEAKANSTNASEGSVENLLTLLLDFLIPDAAAISLGSPPPCPLFVLVLSYLLYKLNNE
jgi:hypothetical protein